LEDRDLDGSII